MEPNLTDHSENNYSENYYHCGSRHWCNAMIASSTCGFLVLVFAVYLLYTMRRDKKVISVYIINLLISEFLQLFGMIAWLTIPYNSVVFLDPNWNLDLIYDYGFLLSVGFMFCVTFERYLVIAHPLWYRFSQPLKMRVRVCVLFWLLPFIPLFVFDPIVYGIYALIPIPFFIFFLLGALKALSAAIHLNSSEKRRIIGILVLSIVFYCLIYLPFIVGTFVTFSSFEIRNISVHLLFFSPLANVILYVFIHKGVLDRLLASLCCCKMDTDQSTMVTVSGTVEQS